ncbi:MAG: choice-of-anchor A family protein, partial [Ruminococcus sp.]|nr:choice-of-anchor A family protein [Ruminococcus sp.]
MNKLAKRSLSFVTAMFMSVMSIVTSISDSLAINSVSNVSETNDTDDVTLLVGNSGDKGEDIASTIKNYEKAYALGIASQFCVFLEGDFNPTDSDTEGRAAVGGNFITETKEYEAGNGDFESKVSLDSLIGNSGYAHAIVNGEKIEGVLPSSWGKYKFPDDNESYVEKRLWIGSDTEIGTIGDNFTNWGSHTWNGNYEDYVYRKSELFDVKYQFKELRKRSKKLSSQKTSETEVIINVNEDSEVRQNDPKVSVNGVAHLKYTGNINDDIEVIKFNLTNEEWQKIVKCNVISYENIPENAYIIINVAGEEIHFTNITNGNYDDKFGAKCTVINGKSISKDYGKIYANNHEGCSRILYNFYDATKVVFGGLFQGTVFAPNADVTDERTDGNTTDTINGHLSGALIAKSFKGGTEFGYRPYTGPYSLLGSVAGYALAVLKVDGENNLLPGATLVLVDEEGNVVSDIETSNEDDYNFITIPTSVDFSGETNYDEVDKKFIKKYILKEEEAPAGYIIDNKTFYTVRITGEILECTKVEGKKYPVPTKINVKVERCAGNDEKNYTKIRDLTYTDAYDKDGNQTSRQIEIISPIKSMTGENDALPIYFTLTIENGKVKGITQKILGEVSEPFDKDYDYDKSGIFHYQFGDNDSIYYYDAENLMITRIPTDNVPEFVNKAKKIQLTKVDGETWTAITESSAELEVYAEGTNKLVASGSTTNGTLDIGHLDPGRYYIKEKRAPEKYGALLDELYFTINSDYSVTRDEDDSYEVSYTLNYANDKKVEGTATINPDDKGNAEFRIENVLTETKLVKDYPREILAKDGDLFFDEKPEYSNVNINKVKVDCDGKHTIQFKYAVNPGGWDEFDGNIEFKGGVITPVKNLHFGDNGYLKLTHWGDSASKITVYCDVKTDVITNDVLESVTIKLEDGVKADSFTFDGIKSTTATINVGKALTDYPTLIMSGIKNTAPNVEIDDQSNPINIDVPNYVANTTTTSTTTTSTTTSTTTTSTTTSTTTTSTTTSTTTT